MDTAANAREVQELEKELHVHIYPGTEVMTDVGSHHFVKGRSHVLVPQPSNSPNDPLNWSPLWKTLCIVSATFATFTQGFGPLALAPMFNYYTKEFDRDLPDVVKFTGVCILVLGFSNFIWVPLSTSFGRRPVYIFSQIINLVSSIWRARAQTYGSFMGACVLNGIGAGPAESIQPAVIADIFFLHDRGLWNTVYWVAYMGSLMLGGIVSGTMSDHLGTRSFWWFNTGLIGLSLVMVVFMFPETKWHRAHPAQQDSQDTDASSQDRVLPQGSSDEIIENNRTKDQSATSTRDLGRETTTEARDPHLGKGSPNRKQWGIYTPCADPIKSILMDLWIPWKLFMFPIVEFSSFVVSWSCSSFLTINLTELQAFSNPPYNYSPEKIGFMNFAILIGAFIGLATAGPLSDWVSARATRKNGGVREPEMRLPAMIPYVLIMILGNFIVAFGYDRKWPWEVIVIIGYTCAGIQVAALPAMATTYAVDSYKPVAGSLMVSITVNKNLWGYGFSEFITKWVERSGFIPPIMTNMALITLWCLFAIPFFYFGKTFRRWSRNDSVHKL